MRLSGDPAYLYKCFHLIIHSRIYISCIYERNFSSSFNILKEKLGYVSKMWHKKQVEKLNSIERAKIYYVYIYTYKIYSTDTISVIHYDPKFLISDTTRITTERESNIYSLTSISPPPWRALLLSSSLAVLKIRHSPKPLQNPRNSEPKITEIAEKK